METRLLFGLGMAICLVAAGLMVADAVSVAWGAALGTVGVGLLGGASSRGANR